MADERDITVDSILASLAKGPTEPEHSKRSWSMSEIDSLLDDDEPIEKYDHYAGFSTEHEEEPSQMSFGRIPTTPVASADSVFQEISETKAAPVDTAAPKEEDSSYLGYFAKRATPKYDLTPREDQAVELPSAEEDLSLDDKPVEDLVQETPVEEAPVEEPTETVEKATRREEKTKVMPAINWSATPVASEDSEAEPASVDQETVDDLGDNFDAASYAEEDYDEEDYDEEDYDEDDYDEEASAEKGNFMSKLLNVRNALVDFLEGGEEEDEYDEEDLVDKESEEENVEKVTDTQPLFREESPSKPEEPAGSSKMIMELADEESELDRAEKRALAGKTIGIHPIRNENIQHQIMTDRIERTGGIMGNDKYRERFLNKPKQKIANTAEYEALHAGEEPEAAERGGYIVKKSKFTNTAGLEPIPTIIAADAELNTFDKTILSKGENPTIKHEEDAEVDGQIKLMGFDDEEPLPQIDEDSAEDMLRERRTQKVAEFRLDSSATQEATEEKARPDERDYEDISSQPPRAARISRNAITTDYLDDEYKKPKDRGRIEEGLNKGQRTTLVSGIVQVACMVLSIVLGILVSVNGGSLEVIGGSAMACIAIYLGLLLVACIFGVRTLVKGLRGFFHQKINASGATTIVVLAALIQEVVILVASTSGAPTASMYTGAACLSLAMDSFARYLSLKRASENFAFITNGTQLYGIENIENEEDAFEIGRNLLIGDPTISYNSRIRHPKKFVENSFADDPADYDAQLPSLVILAASILLGLIFGIIRSSAVDGIGVFAALICMAMPAFRMLSSNVGLFMVDHNFSRTGSVIVGHRAIEESAEINAYAIDSTDIFPEGCCSIVGLKTFHSMRIDDAILYSAALVIDSDSPLSSVFENTILGKKDLLPPTESPAYEERLGLSAWIHGRRILFGNRQLLINHNVEVPAEEFENQYTHNGRKVLYLGIAGKVAAMFVIQYRADKRMRSALQNADRAGITLLVRNTDCNINEELICKYYKLPISAVKVLSPVSGDVLERYRTEEKKMSESGILHNGTVEASLKSIYEARRLYDGLFSNSLIALIYSVIAGLLTVILSATSAIGPATLSDYKVIIFQLIFSVVAIGLPALRSRHAK